MCVFGGGGRSVSVYVSIIFTCFLVTEPVQRVENEMNMLSQSRLVCRTVPLSILLEFAGILHNTLLLLCYILTLFFYYSVYNVSLLHVCWLRLGCIMNFSSTRSHVFGLHTVFTESGSLQDAFRGFSELHGCRFWRG